MKTEDARRALAQHLLRNEWNVFGTLKFVNGRSIGRQSAERLLQSYWKKVDHTYFGKSAERKGLRVPRWCFAHEGADSENFHVHFALLSPIADVELCCCLLNSMWTQHHPQSAPLSENWIMPVRDRPAAANYLTHEYWRMGNDTFLVHLSARQIPQEAMAQYEHDGQASRICNQLNLAQLHQAEQALQAQQARYKEDYYQSR